MPNKEKIAEIANEVTEKLVADTSTEEIVEMVWDLGHDVRTALRVAIYLGRTQIEEIVEGKKLSECKVQAKSPFNDGWTKQFYEEQLSNFEQLREKLKKKLFLKEKH